MRVQDTLSYERIVLSDQDGSVNIIQHILPYAFAAPFCINKEVVDLCCGTGYGTKLLAESARAATGVDYSETAIQYAIEKGGPKNCLFQVMDIEEDEVPIAEVYTCFQGLEHLEEPKLLLDDIASRKAIVLAAVPKGGLDNPFHHHHITEKLLHEWFSDYKIEIQYMVDRLGIFKKEPNEFHNYFIIAKPY